MYDLLRNTSLYREYKFSAFSSISISIKTKLGRKVRKEGDFISCKEWMLISSYSSGEEGEGRNFLLDRSFEKA